jgi:Tetracyclin repressor-like, C-terminal domain
VILQTALAIVDRDGVDGLSMRRLSDAVGRDPVMLYRHVANKAAVLDGVAEIVLAQLSVDTADPDWASQLRSVAHHFRQLALAHPNVVPLLVTRPLATPLGQRPPGMLRPLEDVLALLTSAGFTGDDACTSTGCCSATCMATSSTSCRRSSSDPRKPTTYSGSVCTGSRSPNSPYCVRWHPPWPPTTAPPNSTASSICCCPA